MSRFGSKIKVAMNQKSAVPLKNFFRTTIPAQSASAGPPLGPLLGKYSLNISKFCKDFNEKTKNYKRGIPLPLTVRIKPDRSCTLEIETPPVSYYLKRAAGIPKAGLPRDKEYAGKLTLKHIYEIAKIKHEDPYGRYQIYDLEEVVRMLVRTAVNCKIDIVRDLDPVEYEEFLKKRLLYLEEYESKKEEAKLLRLQRAGTA